MQKIEVKLKQQLLKCRDSLKIGYTSTNIGGIDWLNRFCQNFANFAEIFHIYLRDHLSHEIFENNEHIETGFLCFKQIVCCVRHMEKTLKAEQTGGIAASDARQHFLDRINYCLEKLRIALKSLENASHGKDHSTMNHALENWSFIELLDVALEYLAPYCKYEEETSFENVAEENAEAIFASKNIRSHIDLMLGQALALANVALDQDKRALSALCQKVLGECLAFEDECSSMAKQAKIPDSNRKFKALALEKALLKLERYINESLLRLVYRCFADFEKVSIDKLRVLLRMYEGQDDAGLDELIADFDVNIDRIAQIGNFAIAFAPNVKAKTIIRSTLASFESLDACIIPALYAKSHAASIYSELLEQHFNEEVAIFKNSIQEMIESYDFTACYHELLADGLKKVEKQYDKTILQELVQMGEFLLEHFQTKVNNTELHAKPERLELYKKFTIILRECQAILMCANQVEVQRILKRFKILRSILHKFLSSLSELKDTATTTTTTARTANVGEQAAQTVNDKTAATDKFDLKMLETLGITPSKRSILYQHDENILPEMMRRRAVSDSLRGNTSKLPILTPHKPIPELQTLTTATMAKLKIGKQASDWSSKPLQSIELQQTKVPTSMCNGANEMANNELRLWRHTVKAPCRRESLRTTMFKRQKTSESAEIYSFYKNNSMSLQITEILDQLTCMSSDFFKTQNEK